MDSAHIPEYDLERYCLDSITEESELARLEEHVLACPECAARAQEAQEYIDAMRRGLKSPKSGADV